MYQAMAADGTSVVAMKVVGVIVVIAMVVAAYMVFTARMIIVIN